MSSNGLERNTSYKFSIQAVTPSGTSDAVISSGIKTFPPTYPDAPTNLRGYCHRPNAVTLSWNIPNDNGCPIFEYAIFSQRTHPYFYPPQSERNDVYWRIYPNINDRPPLPTTPGTWWYFWDEQYVHNGVFTVVSRDGWYDSAIDFEVSALNCSGYSYWSNKIRVNIQDPYFTNDYYTFCTPRIPSTKSSVPSSEDYDTLKVPIGASITGVEIYCYGAGGGAFDTGDPCDGGTDGGYGGIAYGRWAVSGGEEIQYHVGRGGKWILRGDKRQLSFPEISEYADGETTWAKIKGSVSSNYLISVSGNSKIEGYGGQGGSFASSNAPEGRGGRGDKSVAYSGGLTPYNWPSSPCYGFSSAGNDGAGKTIFGSPFYPNNILAYDGLHQGYGGFGAVSVKFIFSASAT
jgi:hypothetical protein